MNKRKLLIAIVAISTSFFINASSNISLSNTSDSINDSSPKNKAVAIKGHIIKPFTAQYTISRQGDALGKGIRKLTYLPDNQALYSYHTDLEWLIFSDKRTEKSIVNFKGHQLIPTRYKFLREGTGSNKYYEWEYDIKNKLAFNVVKQQSKAVEFPENIQDKLSYHLQNRLNLILNSEQKTFTYPVISTSGKIKNYTYTFDTIEDVMLPFGLLKTIRLKREVLNKKKVTYAWFAPELNYLLVKLHQNKEGVEQFEAQLESIEETSPK